MWPYWLMFLVPAALALQEARRQQALAAVPAAQARIPANWWFVATLLALLVGWRHQVGGDWFNYLSNFESAYFNIQFDDWWHDDPGYRLLERIAIEADWGIHGVNLMAGAIFSYGLVVFCRHLPRPWLGLAVAIPYLVIILGMGYSR